METICSLLAESIGRDRQNYIHRQAEEIFLCAVAAMTDLTAVLPGFPIARFSHLLRSLDKSLITTADLVSIEAPEIAKRAQLPPVEVAKLIDAVLKGLHESLTAQNHHEETKEPSKQSDAADEEANGDSKVTPAADAPLSISTLDELLDKALGGGIRAGYLSEITGESGVGKTQFLLTSLLSVQLPPPKGLGKAAIYISTEAALSTSRLYQLLRLHPALCDLPRDEKPSLDRVLGIQCPDLETQEHIIRYQLPIAIERQNVGLVVIDSIAANFRAELDKPTAGNGTPLRERDEKKAGKAMAERRSQLTRLGNFLRNLAREKKLVILVANQVADRFEPAYTASQPSSSAASAHITPDPLSLDHQQRWFTGWGDIQEWSFASNLKTPSLGLVWTNQLAARIALVKQTPTGGEAKARRWMRVVFAPWCESSARRGTQYEVVGEGVRGVPTATKTVAAQLG